MSSNLAQPIAFLNALADAIAAIAGVSVPRPATPTKTTLCALWAVAANADIATPIYSVIRTYGNGRRGPHNNSIMIQIRTRASLEKDALERATLLHNTLLVSPSSGRTQRPRTNWTINGFRIGQIIGLRGPTQIGRDEREQWMTVTDFEAPYVAT